MGRKRDKNKDRCDGARCKGGKQGKCRCKSGLNDCPGVKACKNLDTDLVHCGACSNACADGETCCDGACVDLDSNDDHCGECGVECSPGQVCQEGRCRDTGPN